MCPFCLSQTSSSHEKGGEHPSAPQESRAKRVQNVTSGAQLVAALAYNREKLVEDRFNKLECFVTAEHQRAAEQPPPMGSGTVPTPAPEGKAEVKKNILRRMFDTTKSFVSEYFPVPTSQAVLGAKADLENSDADEQFMCSLVVNDKVGQRALQSLAIKMIDNFVSTPSKTPALIREIIQLARVDDGEVVQMLVTALANTIDQNVLFDVPMIEGLAEVLFQCSSRHIPVENLVVIYRMLIAKIETLHSQQQNADRVFQILKGFNKLLRAMWASGVRGLDEEDKKKSLGILQAMKDRYANYKSLECYVAAEAEVAKQNLQRIQDDGDPLADVAARLGHAYMAVGAIANLAMQYDIREVFNCVSELKECVADIYIKKSWMDVLFFIDLMLWQLTVGSKELKPLHPDKQKELKSTIERLYSKSRKVGIRHSEELRDEADAAKKEEATTAEPPSTSGDSAKPGVIMGTLAKAGNKVKDTILTTAHTLKRKASEITSQLNAIIEGEHDFSLGYVNLLDNVIKSEPLHDNVDMKNWALAQLKGILVGEDYRDSTLMKFFNSEVGLMMVVIKLREYSTMPPPIGSTAWQILEEVMDFIQTEEARHQTNRDTKNGLNFGLACYPRKSQFESSCSDIDCPALIYLSEKGQWWYVAPKETGPAERILLSEKTLAAPRPKERPTAEVISCFDDKLNKSDAHFSAQAKAHLSPVKLSFLFFLQTHPIPPTLPVPVSANNDIHPIFQFKMLIPPTKPQTAVAEDSLCTSELFMKAKAEVLATLKDSVDDQVMDLRKRTLEDPQLDTLLKTYVESNCREGVLDKATPPLTDTLFKKLLKLDPPVTSQSHRHHSGRSHSSSSSSSSSTTTETTSTAAAAPPPTKTLVLVGPGGTGKSTFGHFVEKLLWESYDRCHVIPIFISLATIKNPSKRH
ncbi:hypothetical protein Pelo_4670 [Pelomyxa schiedti]|nr:hypothetical protein Pelo_4670 [Pelomyxa schiedti]